MKDSIKNICKLLISILLFFFLSVAVVIVISLFGFNLDGDNNVHLVIVDFITSAMMVILLSAIYFKLIKKSIKNIPIQFGKIVKFISSVFIAFLAMYGVKIVSSLIYSTLLAIFGISETTVDNQALIEELLGSAPAMMIISTSLLAPIYEELLFRGAIKEVIKNKKVFILVSGLIFGLMHVAGSITLLLEILLLGIVLDYIISNEGISIDNKKLLSAISSVIILLIFGGIFYFQKGNLISVIMNADLVEVFGSIIYISMGLFLAALYAKKDNILLNIGVHAVNNILSVIMILFLV